MHPGYLPDGGICFTSTRCEYVDKGQIGTKWLWAMRPDGSGSAEVFGNNVALPPTILPVARDTELANKGLAVLRGMSRAYGGCARGRIVIAACHAASAFGAAAG